MGENNSITRSEAPRPNKGRGASLFFRGALGTDNHGKQGAHKGRPYRES